MRTDVEKELERLTVNSAIRREDLLGSALVRSRRKKLLNIVAGVLALASAATITGAVTKAFGADVFSYLAALSALVSGTISLVVSSYYGEEEVLIRLSGSSKYLALRDAVYRLAITPSVHNRHKLKQLAELQREYSDLDSDYSRYFSIKGRDAKWTGPPMYGRSERAEIAAQNDLNELQRKLRLPSENAP